MKTLIYRTLGIMAVLLTFMLQSCEKLNEMPYSEPYNPKTGKTTVDYLNTIVMDGNHEYDLLASLITRSGIDLTGKTIFAPADINWERWMTANKWATVNDIPLATLVLTLKYHIVEGLKKRLDLDLPNQNPQTTVGTDVPSTVVNLAGTTLWVNVTSFGLNGRGLQESVGSKSSAMRLVQVGDIECTDAIVHLYGFIDVAASAQGLLTP